MTDWMRALSRLSAGRSSLPVELADLLVDHREHVVDAIGDRQIDGDSRRPHRPRGATAEEVAGSVLLRVARLGERNEIGEEVDLLADARASAIDDVDELLEIEQPERQAQIARADDLGLVLEGGRVFVVRIDEEHARRLGSLQDAVEDERDRARLAATGRAEDREMLLQKVLHPERRLDGIVLAQSADRDRLLAMIVVDRLKVGGVHLVDGGADRRIGADAAVEGRLATVLRRADLALQLDARQHRVRTARTSRLGRIDQRRRCHEPAGFDREQLADGKRIAVARAVGACAVDRDDRPRAADRDDLAERHLLARRMRLRNCGLRTDLAAL